MPEAQGWTPVDEPQGWTPVVEESPGDKLKRTVQALRDQNRRNESVGQGDSPLTTFGKGMYRDVMNLPVQIAKAQLTQGYEIAKSGGQLLNPLAFPYQGYQQAEFMAQHIDTPPTISEVAGQAGIDLPGAKADILGHNVPGALQKVLNPVAQAAAIGGILEAAPRPGSGPSPGTGKLAYGGKGEPSPEVIKRVDVAEQNAAMRAKQSGLESVKAARSALTERVKANVEETHAVARASLDQRWDAMREKVGQAPADPAKLSTVEADARTANLANATPDAVAKFDSIMEKVREPGGGDAFENQVAEGLGYKAARGANKSAADVARTQIAGGAKTFDNMVARLRSESVGTAEGAASDTALFQRAKAELGPSATVSQVAQRAQQMKAAASGGNTFGELQNRYTRLGEELSKGNLPNETFRALKQVREGYGQHMQEIAGQHGMGNELASLKNDWSQYMEDFKNSGSPVARALSAQDLPVVTRNAAGNTYARFAEIMGRNKQHGGNPALVQELKGLAAREAAMKAPRPKQMPRTTAKVSGKPSRVKVMLGGAGGALAGMAVGHPVLGYYAGKEAVRNYLSGKK